MVAEPPALLAQATVADTASVEVETRPVDLNAIADADARTLFPNAAVVTASALLDLVSEDWLRALAEHCRETGAALLFALSYDGRIDFSPDEPEDAEVRDLVNRHQRTDKGFGPALGPDATDAADRILRGLGYHVERERTDWTLGAESCELQRRLIDGWADAAIEMAPDRRDAIESWRSRRRAHVAVEQSRVVVGHWDLAAWKDES